MFRGIMIEHLINKISVSTTLFMNDKLPNCNYCWCEPRNCGNPRIQPGLNFSTISDKPQKTILQKTSIFQGSCPRTRTLLRFYSFPEWKSFQIFSLKIRWICEKYPCQFRTRDIFSWCNDLHQNHLALCRHKTSPINVMHFPDFSWVSPTKNFV